MKATLVQDPARMCEILVGLPEVTVLGVDDSGPVLEVHVECCRVRPDCPECGVFEAQVLGEAAKV